MYFSQHQTHLPLRSTSDRSSTRDHLSRAAGVKIKFTLAYDGTCYAGWQIQPNASTIQEAIETALEKIFSQKIPIVGSGRTDSGVHAKGQVAHCTLPKETPTLQKSLNALLPDDIRILEVTRADEDFHARYSAKEKNYLYHIHTSPILNPFTRKYCHHDTRPLDLEKIKEAISYLEGKHDFSALANAIGPTSKKPNPVKNLYEIRLTEVEGGITLLYRGDGFLYKMVRNLTGLLLDVGQEKLSPSDAKKILESKDRKRASRAAPAQGLTLLQVHY